MSIILVEGKQKYLLQYIISSLKNIFVKYLRLYIYYLTKASLIRQRKNY